MEEAHLRCQQQEKPARSECAGPPHLSCSTTHRKLKPVDTELAVAPPLKLAAWNEDRRFLVQKKRGCLDQERLQPMRRSKERPLLVLLLAQTAREMRLCYSSRRPMTLFETRANARGSRAVGAGEYVDAHPQSVQGSVVAILEESLHRSPWDARGHTRGSAPTLPETGRPCCATSPVSRRVQQPPEQARLKGLPAADS